MLHLRRMRGPDGGQRQQGAGGDGVRVRAAALVAAHEADQLGDDQLAVPAVQAEQAAVRAGGQARQRRVPVAEEGAQHLQQHLGVALQHVRIVAAQVLDVRAGQLVGLDLAPDLPGGGGWEWIGSISRVPGHILFV